MPVHPIFSCKAMSGAELFPFITVSAQDNKQLLDEVFVISRIIKVEVRVIS